MKDTLRKLLELQSIDGEIIELQRVVSCIPQSLHKEHEHYSKALEELETEKQLQEAREKECQDREVDAASVADTVKQLQSKQSQIKKNQEYQALSHEIKQAEEKHERTQAALEQQKSGISDAAARVTEQESAVGTSKDELLEHAGQAKKEVEQIVLKIKRCRAQREELAQSIDSDVFGLYEKLLKTRAPHVLVPANKDVCAGCHINLPAQVVADIMKLDRLVVCENCARILYIAPEETDAAS
jgi:predicted  nucleic acid-binding Zn-ribbon protein